MLRVPWLGACLALCGCAHGGGVPPLHPANALLHDGVAQLVVQGEALAKAGDLTRAEQYLSAALQAGYDPQRTLPTLLFVCVRASRLRSALLYATPYLLAHPNEAHLRQFVAAILLAMGELKQAEAELRAVIACDPDLPQAEFMLASLLRSLGRDQEAAVHYARYLSLAPDGPHAEEASASMAVQSVWGSESAHRIP